MISVPEKPPNTIWPKYRFFPLGDSALTVECENLIDSRIGRIARSIASSLTNHGFSGLIEAVPAFASTTIFYDPAVVTRSFPDYPTAFDAVQAFVSERTEQLIFVGDPDARQIEIPMLVNTRTAPDLGRVAEMAELSQESVLETFLSQTYRVYMLGFLPGFAYMGEVDDRIAAPRLETPRTKVPKGSIGIAGKQTGIYPLESPGGWNIIGRTDLKMFDPAAENPCLLKPGDEVRFIRC